MSYYSFMELLDHELVSSEPLDTYTVLDDSFKSGFFAGFLIKNLYDEKRFNIHKKWTPEKILFNSNNGPYRLYGMVKSIGEENKLIKQLINRPPQNIGDYSSILSANNFSCLHCFLHFSPGLYPIDNFYLPEIFPDLNIENFNNNNHVPPFQRIGHIYFFAIVNHKYL